MNIIFVRHGESESNAKISKDKNSRLTKKGERQAEYLGKRLRRYNISEIYTSNLIRSKQTGKIVSDILKIPVKESLTELDEYPGNYLKSRFRIFSLKLGKRKNRLKIFLNKISKERKSDKTILIVAHGITNRIIMGHLSQIPINKRILRFSQENSCVNILSWKEEYNNWNINCVNDIEHLPLKLRSSYHLR